MRLRPASPDSDMMCSPCSSPIVPTCCDRIAVCLPPDCDQVAEPMGECTEDCIIVPCADACFDASATECKGCCNSWDSWECDSAQCKPSPACDEPCCQGCSGYQSTSNDLSSQRYMELNHENDLSSFLASYHPDSLQSSNQDTAGSRFLSPSFAESPSLHRFALTSAFRSTTTSEHHHHQLLNAPQSSAPSITPPEEGEPSPVSCMWGNCRQAFISPADLVSHVNAVHLRSGSQPNTPAHAHLQADPAHEDVFACLWANCGINLSPEIVPGPSTGATTSPNFYALASHLLLDHLGIDQPAHQVLSPSPQPKPEPNKSSHSLSASPASQLQLPSPAPSNAAAGEDGTHACGWESCVEVFSTSSDLTNHITLVHVGSGKAQYHCRWGACDRHGERSFSSKQKILRHIQSHTGHKPFTCETCGERFSEAATLQQHMRRHTQEKPYVCDFPGCRKAFAITGALTIHKRTHNGEKPFKCSYCDRAFSESSNLSKHLRTHTGARPYACSEEGCDKRFARPDQLARHLRTHNKKEDFPGQSILSYP